MEYVNRLTGKKIVKQKNYQKANTPTVYQMEITECGAASLSMIMQYYGVYISLEQLRMDTGVSRDGCKASKICQGARKHGFMARGVKCNLEDVFRLKPPCIIHWNFNHFMIYEGKSRNYVYINDPAQGKRRLTIDEFDEGFTGIVLVIEPGKTLVKQKNKSTLLPFVLQRLKGQYGGVMYLLFLGLLLVIPGIVIPVFSQIFIDEVLTRGNTWWLIPLVASMLGVSLVQVIFTAYRNFILNRLKNKMSLITAYHFLHHLFCLPIDFFSQRYAGDIGERVENNNNISEFLGGELAAGILNVLIAFFYLVLLAAYSPLLTIISIGILSLYFILTKCSYQVFSRTIMKLQQDIGKLTGVVISGISIIATLKASGIETEYTGRVLGFYTKAMEEKQKYQKIQIIMNDMSGLVMQLCKVIVLITGGFLVIRGRMTTGTLIAYGLLLGYFITPVNELIGFGQKLQKMKADMVRVQDILQYKQDEIFDKRNKVVEVKGKLKGKIQIENLVFGYSNLEKPLIDGFHFRLESGKSIAIVGSSGSGKSTVSKLLSGLYTPWEGNICFDDIPLKQLLPETINYSVATVSQEVHIFTGSFKENITLWNPAIREEDIIKAAKDAALHELITKKPGAYEYPLEEGGKNLSGGQKQRLEIARALVLNPTILIMDEATSALDAITEKEIIDNIKRRGCTCVIVAHRLSAIRDCDEILVMEQGKVIQRGNHKELSNVPGTYHELCCVAQ